MSLQNVMAVDNGKVIGVNTEKIATSSTPGIVKPDGETISVNGNGVISTNGLNLGFFDITVTNAKTYNFTNDRPSDFGRIIGATNVGGSGSMIMQCSSTTLYLSETVSTSYFRILYLKA